MPEPVIYRDLPLGEYLEGTGTFEGDWGVFSSPDDGRESPLPQDFAPPARSMQSRKIISRELKPLLIVDENISRAAKFYDLFITSISPHIPPPETARFQERLRYIICTSQLLSEKIAPSLYLEASSHEHVDVFVRERTLRYWMGTSGCVIVVAFMVSWTLRDGSGTKPTKARNLAALALSLLVAVYLYAYARRRYTRLLRARTLELVDSLVRNSQAFDVTAHKTLQLIQEVELVSRGSASLPPITRLEQSSSLRRCANLRTTLAASITLATSSFHRASTILTQFATPSLLRQMHQVYNIDDTLPSDLHELPSLVDLKANYLVLHEKRRHLLCCILAIHVEPYNPAWPTWQAIIRELSGLTRILSSFTTEVQRTLEDEQNFDIPSRIPRSLPDHARGLSFLSANVRTITAKMTLLKQDLSSSLHTLPEDQRQSVFDTYDSIGQDLHSLLNDWQSGRADLVAFLSPPEPSPKDDTESTADSGVGISLPETEPQKRESCGDWGVSFSSPISADLDDINEAVVEGLAKGRGGLTRAERVEKARREREELAERKRIAEDRAQWMGELKDVLYKRR